MRDRDQDQAQIFFSQAEVVTQLSAETTHAKTRIAMYNDINTKNRMYSRR